VVDVRVTALDCDCRYNPPGKFLAESVIVAEGDSAVEFPKVKSGIMRFIKMNSSPSPISIWLLSMKAVIADIGRVLPSSNPVSWLYKK